MASLIIFCKIHCLYLPTFSLVCDLIFLNIFWKALLIVIPLLSFKEITYAYLMKMSRIHNENLNPLLNLFVKCVSARSTPQILYIKDEGTFSFLKLFIIGFQLTLWLKYSHYQKSFHEKSYKPLKQDPFDIHHIFDF